MAFILYLAVDEYVRNKGYGSYLLNWFTEQEKDKEIFLNIDELNSKYKDNEIRKKRLKFYKKNKFYITNYLSIEECGNFNILSNKNNFNLNEYIKLDYEISKRFFNKKSIIKNKKEVEKRII